jgi:hypothetical protein
MSLQILVFSQFMSQTIARDGLALSGRRNQKKMGLSLL